MNDTLSTTTIDLVPYRDRLLDACDVLVEHIWASLSTLAEPSARVMALHGLFAGARSVEPLRAESHLHNRVEGPASVLSELHLATVNAEVPTIGARLLTEHFEKSVLRAGALLLNGQTCGSWDDLTAHFAKATEHLVDEAAK